MRHSETDSKGEIFAAASYLFSEQGYSATTVRQIAQRAGIDPAMVIRHFHTKETLFLETMRALVDLELPITPPVETLGRRIVAALLDASPGMRKTYLALLRASEVPSVREVLRQANSLGIVRPLEDLLECPDAGLRAHATAAMVGGFAYALWLLEDPALTGADREALLEHYGNSIQAALTGPSSNLAR